ncbi:hypothetical protein GCM10009555_017450 [Acrocarpospora macrocephala]|uniref:Head-to-tail adaptor n=1 Tax=Acrocarpospora macrocephala TaxID=150177 RepID=A0A5M3WE91_9ACTN|nr:hypothetical protein [Acrocarpospora macrocephala]GES07405.1 hypothetical protein Amac_010000 [Acrocarpospora macrocephala]
MLNAGDPQIASLLINPGDGTTAATLTVYAPDGTSTTAAVTVSETDDDGVRMASAAVTYPVAGLYVLAWVVTGIGAGVEHQQVPVAPAVTTVPQGRVYATTTDLANKLRKAPPLNAPILLERASRLVDKELLCAIYDVDDDGLPTDPVHIEAMRDATVEQVAAWSPIGEDGTGVTDHYTNVKLGSASMSRGGGSSGGSQKGSAAEELAPQARMILQQAGLTGHGPWTPY